MLHKTLTINLLLIILFAFSCKEEQTKLPIPQEALENILTDIHLAEAAMQYTADEKRDSLEEVYYGQIFEIHNVSREVFLECMAILESDPRRNSIIYQNLMDGLEKRKDEATAKKPPTKTREWNQDSLSQE